MSFTDPFEPEAKALVLDAAARIKAGAPQMSNKDCLVQAVLDYFAHAATSAAAVVINGAVQTNNMLTSHPIGSPAWQAEINQEVQRALHDVREQLGHGTFDELATNVNMHEVGRPEQIADALGRALADMLRPNAKQAGQMLSRYGIVKSDIDGLTAAAGVAEGQMAPSPMPPPSAPPAEAPKPKGGRRSKKAEGVAPPPSVGSAPPAPAPDLDQQNAELARLLGGGPNDVILPPPGSPPSPAPGPLPPPTTLPAPQSDGVTPPAQPAAAAGAGRTTPAKGAAPKVDLGRAFAKYKEGTSLDTQTLAELTGIPRSSIGNYLAGRTEPRVKGTNSLRALRGDIDLRIAALREAGELVDQAIAQAG